MRHRSNYDWMLFLTSPMTFVRTETHDLILTRQTLKPLIDHGCSIEIYLIWSYELV